MYTKLKTLPIPGFIWFAGLVLATAAIYIYIPDNAPLATAALIVLGGIAKAVDVRYDKVIEVVEDELNTEIDIIDVEGWMPPGAASRAAGHRGSIAPLRSPEPYTELVDASPSRAQVALRWLVG